MEGQDSISKKPSATSEDAPPDGLVFFVDRCLGRGVWKALRGAGFNVEHKDDHFEQNTADDVWMPEVGRRGWIVLTRDTRIRFHPHEREAIFASNMKFFSLQTKRGAAGKRGISGKEMVELLVNSMERITKVVATTPPPFIAGITRTGVRVLYSPTSHS